MTPACSSEAAEALLEELADHGVVLHAQLGRDAVVEDLADLGVIEVVLGPGGMDEVVDLLQELQRLEQHHAIDAQAAQDRAEWNTSPSTAPSSRMSRSACCRRLSRRMTTS